MVNSPSQLRSSGRLHILHLPEFPPVHGEFEDQQEPPTHQLRPDIQQHSSPPYNYAERHQIRVRSPYHFAV